MGAQNTSANSAKKSFNYYFSAAVPVPMFPETTMPVIVVVSIKLYMVAVDLGDNSVLYKHKSTNGICSSPVQAPL